MFASRRYAQMFSQDHTRTLCTQSLVQLCLHGTGRAVPPHGGTAGCVHHAQLAATPAAREPLVALQRLLHKRGKYMQFTFTNLNPKP